MNNIKNKFIFQKLPKHIAVIMDGNGRWAKQRGKERIYGHHNGVNSVRECVEGCREAGVKYLTLYAFSTENWNRPTEEVNELMNLLVRTINEEVPSLIKNEIRLKFIGDFSKLYPETVKIIEDAQNKTASNDKLTVIIALSYSSKWEIINAIKQITDDICENKIVKNEIDYKLFEKYLYTSGIPDPELLIRTGGEQRISNFLLWQIAYSELYFTKVMWPDFTKEDLFDAIIDYQNRERRFGKISEQIKTV